MGRRKSNEITTQTRAIKAAEKLKGNKYDLPSIIDNDGVHQVVQATARFMFLPIINLDDPEAIMNRFQEFCNLCDETGLRPTWDLFAISCGYKRFILSDRVRGHTKCDPEVRKVLARINEFTSAVLTQLTVIGKAPPLYTIFLQRNNAGYTNDDNKNDMSTREEETTESVEEIAEKYKDIID